MTIFLTAAAAALAGILGILGWQVFRARAAAELAAAILRDLSGAVRERKEEMDGAEMRKAAPAAESARKAREAIERFNEGVANILNYDAGGRGREG